MIEFIQKQLEASERLFEMMREDHKERMKEIEVWAQASRSLMQKLDERDRLIAILREDNRTTTPWSAKKKSTPFADGSKSSKSNWSTWPRTTDR